MISNEVDEKLKECLRLLDQSLSLLLPGYRTEAVCIIKATRLIEAVLGSDSDAVI